MAGDAEALCTQCGVCCDGMLFTQFEFEPDEDVSVLKATGLRVLQGAKNEQGCFPCTALKGTSCSVYEHRPRICRDFRCGLLRRLEKGEIGLEEAIERTGTAKRLRTELVEQVRASFPIPDGVSVGEMMEQVDLQGIAKSPARRREHAAILLRWTALSTFISRYFDAETRPASPEKAG